MSTRSFSPLLPGVRLMQRLRMPVKLGLMGLMLLVPLLLLVVTTYSSTREEIRVAALELDGARQISNLVDLVTQLQSLRDLSSRALNGDEAAKTQRGAVTKDIKATLAALTDQKASEVMNTEPAFWTSLQKSVLDLADGRGPTRRDELFALQTQLVDQVRQQMMLTGEASGLLLDPESTSFFLMDLAVVRIVPWMESLSVARGQGVALLTRGEATNTDRAKMLGHADRVRAEVQDMALRMAALKRSGMAEPAEWTAARTASDRFADAIRAVFTAEAITAEPGPYYEQAGASIAAAVALKQAVVVALTRELEQRVSAKTAALWVKMGVALAGLLLLGYFAWAFYVSFSGALRTLHKGVDKVLGGDLSHQIVIRGRDELSEIGTMVERMNERLSSLVAEIRSSAARVSMSGERVAADSKSLAARTEEQAASLRQAVITVRQLSEAVAANAAEANQLDTLTARLRDQAEAGGEAMRASVESMTQLEDGSRRVGEIIGVIDSIAFQTNILALNAAVEAARAGEAGRGFAVVAAEVRTLAQRSASASAEIRGLIARSGEQVESSVKRTRHIGQTLSAVVDGVRAVSTSLQSIAKASAAQSSDLEEVTQSVGSLDEITRSNAQMVEASTAAAGELVQRAGKLQESVATIRLRQGSADEAETLVQRAFKLIKGSSLGNVGPTLHSREQGFVDRDLYVFVIDRQGRYVLHGAKPAMEGKRVHEVPGIDGDRFVSEAWTAALSREGRGGWVEYDIVNPGTGVVQPKASFVVALNADLFVGCGIYRTQSMASA